MQKQKEKVLKDIWQIADGKSSQSKIGSRSIPHHLRPYEKEFFKICIEKGYMILKHDDRPNLENLFYLYNSQLNQPTFIYRESKQFPTNLSEVIDKIQSINPFEYSKSRNFLDGYVTQISPYLTHGLINLPQVLSIVKSKHPSLNLNNQFVRELAWREYFQNVYESKQDKIFDPNGLKNNLSFKNELFPLSIFNATTGIKTIDQSILDLYQTGYIHNHSRMWIASLVSNLSQTHWSIGAKWMFYHLLDGDLASNYLSWQWIAGTFSSKKYYANQENLNKYSPLHLNQTGTFLDLSYEQLISKQDFSIFDDKIEIPYQTDISSIKSDEIQNKPTMLYSIWTLTPEINTEETLDIKQKVLLLEPSFFKSHPMSPQRITFILALAKNIKSLKILVSDIEQVTKYINSENIYIHDHPAIMKWHKYSNLITPQPKLFSNISGFFPSFFSFWKKVEKLNSI